MYITIEHHKRLGFFDSSHRSWQPCQQRAKLVVAVVWGDEKVGKWSAIDGSPSYSIYLLKIMKSLWTVESC